MDSMALELTGLSYVGGVICTFAICLNARALGSKLKVMAHPDSVRKRHGVATPQLGGVAILAAVVIWLVAGLILHRGSAPILTSLLICGAGAGLVGFTDDQHDTSPVSRILFLCLFLVAAVTLDPLLMTQRLHWASFGEGSIPIWAYSLLTATAVIGLVNAVNMADGQNGIVGGMFAIWCICLMLVTGGIERGVASLIFGADLIFLAFNMRGRIFLGDCGTYGVTFLLAMLTIGAHAASRVPIETVAVWFFIPVMDCLRLLISRSLEGRSPFNGDRDHFHHRLEDNLGKRFGLAAYLGVVACSSLLATMEPRFALLSLAMLSAFYFSFAWLPGKSVDSRRETLLSSGNERVIAMADKRQLRRERS